MSGTLLTRIARDEDGGAYTLSYVMVVPFVMFFLCLVVESTMMLSAKLGTVYAAYAGARAGSVWSSATSWSNAEQRIERAAVKAFVPFASGSASSSGGGNALTDGAEIDRYYASYEAFVDKPVSKTYVRKKYTNALNSLTVTTNGPPTRWDADLTVKVSFKSPFRIPGIGRLLGEDGGGGRYYFPLTSEVTLQNEGPQNSTQRLGIGYGNVE